METESLTRCPSAVPLGLLLPSQPMHLALQVQRPFFECLPCFFFSHSFRSRSWRFTFRATQDIIMGALRIWSMRSGSSFSFFSFGIRSFSLSTGTLVTRFLTSCIFLTFFTHAKWYSAQCMISGRVQVYWDLHKKLYCQPNSEMLSSTRCIRSLSLPLKIGQNSRGPVDFWFKHVLRKNTGP